MSPAVLSCVIFALTLGGIVLGGLLRTTLPQHHLSKDSQDVVRLGVGLIATIAALVLGLLIAAAKGSFDTQSGQVKQITADIILLDALLDQYGPEALPIGTQMRGVIGPFADRLWHETPAAAAPKSACGPSSPRASRANSRRSSPITFTLPCRPPKRVRRTGPRTMRSKRNLRALRNFTTCNASRGLERPAWNASTTRWMAGGRNRFT